ncbi:M16 family metallopeptidase [Pedobacter cryophilus]|uniref:Insulinase family protein n=1 Tax=Pedobacter cryophilus TaxID=2571271 RepID=A0A4U1BUT1_9SPHI|nr:pitrilysin family protein [Pedobacter cryophilus]TKB95764.1 insulinase family protein [Pedobacter cryophilus]
MKKIVSIMMLPFLLLAVSINITNAQEAFKVPAYQKFILKNGLTIYLMEQHEVPTISLAAVIPAGAIYDGQKNGLAALTADGLQYGTKSYTKSEIEKQLDFLGASLNTSASKESANLSAKFAKVDQDKVLPIIKEVLLHPVFNQQEFDKEKARGLQELERAKESPRNVMGNYWDKFIYGEHPYANPTSGKPSTITNINTSDLKAFYQSNYHPNGSAITLVGDFNAKLMKEKITKLFGEWKKGSENSMKITMPEALPTKSRVLLVNKEDARETTMYIGGKGISRNNPDYVAIEVVNTVLGGRFTSWLNDELRVNSGLTYGANSRFAALKNAGTFYVSTFTATKTTEPTVDKALEVLKKLREKGMDEETLTSAKNYVKGQFPPDYETSSQLASLLTQMFWYGFDESYINNFQVNVDGLTSAKAKEIVAKYFPADNLQFLFIGKSADIKSIVEKYGPVTEKQIKTDGY